MKNHPLKKTFIFLLLLLPNLSLANPVIEIDKIIIQKPTQSQTLNTTSEEIDYENTTELNTSLSESLNRQSGVHLQKYGGLEASTAVSIRGSNGQDVQIFLDGIPLDSASNQGINLGNLSLNQISKIQIFKSLSPAELGSLNQAGTISIESKPIPLGWHGTFGLQYGSFSTISGFGSSSFGKNKHRFHLSFDFLSTQGDFTYTDNNGTPLNPNDDSRTTRQNNFNRTWHPSFKWEGHIHPNHRLTFTTHFFSVHKGVPGLENFQSTTADLHLYESLNTLQWQTEPSFAKTWSLQNQAYGRWILSEFSDPNGEIGLGSGQDNHNTTWIFGNKFAAKKQFSQNASLKFLSHYSFESFSPKDDLAANSQGSTSERHLVQTAIEPNFILWNDTFDITAKLQSLIAFYDINNDDPSLANAATFFSNRTETPLVFALNLRKQLFDNFYLKGNVARDVRLPKFTEMFGDQGFVLGNAELTSEKNIKWDTGVIWSQSFNSVIESLRAELSFFQTFSEDLIEFELINGLARANNIGSSRITGVESFFHIEANRFLSFNLNYTYLHAKDTTAANRFLIGRPKHEVNVSTNFQHNDVSVTNHFNWIDDKFLNTLNTKVINNRLRWDTNVNYTLSKNHTLSFEFKNITNSQIVDVLGFPLPGRSFYAFWKAQW